MRFALFTVATLFAANQAAAMKMDEDDEFSLAQTVDEMDFDAEMNMLA